MTAWQQDSMTKVFQHPLAATGPATAPAAAPADAKMIPLHAARNEVISAQFVLRAAKDCDDLKVQAQPLLGPEGAKITALRVRYVGYVPVQKNSDDSAIRPAPGNFPDPLLESAPPLKADSFQPIWITITVPKDAPAGEYAGQIVVTAGGSSMQLPLQLTVHPAVLSDERTLLVSNWLLYRQGADERLYMDKLYGFPCNFDEERYWTLLSAFARNMAGHRQNVILTTLVDNFTPEHNDLLQVGADADGKLTFDFSRFDRWVKTFADAGVIAPPRKGVIEGFVLGFGQYASTDQMSTIWTAKNGKAIRERVSSWSEANKLFLKAYLPALQAHLEKTGWLEMYRQHVIDEPVDANSKYYRDLAKVVREAAPKLKLIDATHTTEIAGLIDTWVPETDYMAKTLDFYKERQKAGDELWFYTCMNPVAPHLNRFIDSPLLTTRLLHWLNFKYDVSGYLHWGWNFWPEDPFADVGGLPGDWHIVYPKPGGVLDSIRYEAMLEGIQDYELLQALAAKDPRKAQAICDQVLQDWTHYTLDVDIFRAARKQLLEALSQK